MRRSIKQNSIVLRITVPQALLASPTRLGCRLLALSGHHDRAEPCPLLRVKRTSCGDAPMSAYDPKRTSWRSRPSSLCSDAGCLNDRRPLFDFGFLKGAQSLGRLLLGGRNFIPLGFEFLTNARIAQRVHDCCTKPFDDGSWCALRGKQPLPYREIEFVQSRLAHCRDFWRCRCALFWPLRQALSQYRKPSAVMQP